MSEITENRYTAGKKVALIGIAANIALLTFKLAVGYTNQSQAMIADGFNSVGDVFASVVTLLGSAYAAKPKDAEHVWGHGKAEYIASMIIGFSMIAMAVFSIQGSVVSISEGNGITFNWWLAGVAILTICVKATLYMFCVRENKKYNSLLISANAQDHRNDVFVSSGTLAAILLSLIGAEWADGVVGIAIACWIAYNGFGIIKEASNVLMDANAAKDMLEECRHEIMKVDGIDHVDSVVAKPVGAKYILVVKISVSREMKVLESHEIGKKVERCLMAHRRDVEDVIVHINPDLPHDIYGDD